MKIHWYQCLLPVGLVCWGLSATLFNVESREWTAFSYLTKFGAARFSILSFLIMGIGSSLFFINKAYTQLQMLNRSDSYNRAVSNQGWQISSFVICSCCLMFYSHFNLQYEIPLSLGIEETEGIISRPFSIAPLQLDSIPVTPKQEGIE